MSGDQPAALHPPVLWAQRGDCVYVTIALGDVKEKVLELKNNSLHFRGKSGTPKLLNYEVLLEFYGEVVPDQSREISTDREIVMHIKKKENGSWPHLLASADKKPWLKIDFSRWVDESDSEAEGDKMDFSKLLSGMPPMSDYNDMDNDVDSDDEDLPDLEIPSKAGEEKSSANGEADEEEKKKVEVTE